MSNDFLVRPDGRILRCSDSSNTRFRVEDQERDERRDAMGRSGSTRQGVREAKAFDSAPGARGWRRSGPARQRVSAADGFTLLELLVVMTIIGILAAIAVPALKNSPQKGREAALREDLFTFRETLDEYHGDKGHYPPDLPTLVSDGYLRKIPVDPVTKSADTWQTALEPVAEDEGSSEEPAVPGIMDVHSGSKAKALDGTTYDTW